MSSVYTVCRPPSVDGVAELARGGVEGRALANQGHPDHWHAEWQMVAVTRGDGWVRVKGTQHRTPAGSIFLIPPEEVHSNNVFADGCDFRSMLIDAHVFGEIATQAGLKLKRRVIARSPVLHSATLASRFDQFHRQLEADIPRIDLENELEDWVSELVGRQTGQNPESPLSASSIHPAARRAREYLWARAAENFSLTELATAVGLSRFELCRAFKAAYGMPPHAWQLQVRVQHSKDLLKRGASAAETAILMGFSDQAHLSRVFKRTTGFTPARYGAQFRNIVQDPDDRINDSRA